jgi:predicted RNase H-like HicB family nuclease
VNTSQGYVVVTVRVVHDEETGQWESYCDELGVATCGDTIEDALAMIDEAVELYLEELEDLGQRDRVLRERHIEVLSGRADGSGAPRQLPPSVPLCPGELLSRREVRVPIPV